MDALGQALSHSYCQNYVHAVYSTKERQKLIGAEIERRFYGYLSGVAQQHQVPLLCAGGMADHTHLLFKLPSTMAVSAAVNLFKTNSSRFLNEQEIRFEWQQGYGAFSVSLSQLKKTIAYIQHQPEHHRKMTFEEEFRLLLEKSGVAYDPKYVFG